MPINANARAVQDAVWQHIDAECQFSTDVVFYEFNRVECLFFVLFAVVVCAAVICAARNWQQSFVVNSQVIHCQRPFLLLLRLCIFDNVDVGARSSVTVTKAASPLIVPAKTLVSSITPRSVILDTK